MNRVRASLMTVGLVIGFAACGDDGPDNADDSVTDGEASISFAAPADGDTVSSPVTVEMEASGVTIEEAGELHEGAGHFHVMVDTECVAEGEVIPEDESHIHYGDASTETEIELEPGEHTLCLQIGDGAHTATNLTDEITVTVE